jgi:hypoxanthine phosphoribosyltransferase
MRDLYISWSEYHQKIEQLAAKIYQSGWQFNQIVCIARGGVRVGDILSRIYRQPLAILAVSSYGGAGGQVRGAVKLSNHLTMTAGKLGSHVLLVDDLVDSGISLQRTVSWLKSHHGADIEEIRTAVIWHKACSCVTPDYCADYLPDSPWIHQPFERYEQISPAELAANSPTHVQLSPLPPIYSNR